MINEQVLISMFTGTLTAILFAFNVYLAKKRMFSLEPKTHIFMKYISVSFFSLIVATFNWKLIINVSMLLLFLGLILSRTLFGYFAAQSLDKINISFVSLVIKSRIILIGLFEILLGYNTQPYIFLFSLIVYAFGLYLFLGISKEFKKITIIQKKKLTICLLSGSIRPIIVRFLLIGGETNSETLLFLEFFLSSVIMFVILKPNISSANKKIKQNYILQGIISFIGNVSLTVGFSLGIITVTTIFQSLEIFFVFLFSVLFMKKTIKKHQILGLSVCFIALLFVSKYS